MSKKQSPLPPNQSPDPNPNPLGKKQPPPPPNPNHMAKKQPPPPPPPNNNNPNKKVAKKQPPPSSSSEDGESSSASTEGGAIIRKPNTQAPANNQEKEEEEEEETGYETESSEDEEGEEVNQPETKRAQPISTTAAIPAPKPCDAGKKPNGEVEADGGGEEGQSDSSSGGDEERVSNTKKARATPTTAATPVLKPRDGGEKPNGEGNPGRKTLFQRIWTLEDEIGILKAIARFEAEHGPVKINPTGIQPFHDFVRASLSLEVSDSQLYEKVRRLRRKYESCANRGKTIRFRRAHDEKVYELSKKIWGPARSGDTEAEKVVKSERATAAAPGIIGGAAGSESLKRKYPFLRDGMARSLSAELLETVFDPESARLLEAQFRNQKVAEINYMKCEMKLMTAAFDKFLEDMKKGSAE